jgi:putative molybdopterin biosynthesis protein
MPKGSNAVVMVEYTDNDEDEVLIYKPVAPGENVMAAGSDVMTGELVTRKGTKLTSKEIGLLAASGFWSVPVYKKPEVAIISTGDEIVEPWDELDFGEIYNINAYTIANRVIENGGEPRYLGIVGDDGEMISRKIEEGLQYEIVILSGNTSAGVGDILCGIIEEMGDVLIHGVAVKPGKPIIVGKCREKPVFGLPGYPTSALITFDLFVSPLMRRISGVRVSRDVRSVDAAMRIHSAKGRHEYLPVKIVQGMAYPILSGSGAITTLANADGYINLPANVEMIEGGEEVEFFSFGDTNPADLCIIGSHCIGLDVLARIMGEYSLGVKIINVGSMGGLAAVKRGESDVSGIHLLDEETDEYNIPFLKGVDAFLIRGYDREQGLVIQNGNPKEITGIGDLSRDGLSFINRNPGSGTRVLLDLELKKMGVGKDEIRGYDIETKSHSAVAAAVAHRKADVGLAIKTVADQYHLDFIPIRNEKYDFAVPTDKIDKISIFLKILRSERFHTEIEKIGLHPSEETGEIILNGREKED